MMRFRFRWLPAAALALSLARLPVAAAERPNVIVILIDACRADHLDTYGFPIKNTPVIDRFAADSIVFDRCISAAPWTKPSVSSLMTSVYPEIHGVVNSRWPPVPNAPVSTEILPPEAVTMAEAFHKAGYRTVGFFSNHWMKDPYGFSQGFDRFQFEDRGYLNDVANAWVSTTAANVQPFFLYIHIMDVHGPYEFDRADFDHLKAALPASLDQPITPAQRAAMNFYMKDVWKGDEKPMGDRLINWRAAYAAGVKRCDTRLGGLMRALRESGLYDKSLIVFLSDHGEGLFEHDQMEHGETLHIEELHVPLIVHLPGGRGAGKRIPEWVSLLDVMPTLAQLTGLPKEAQWEGSSFVPALSSGHAEGRDQFSWAEMHDLKARSVIHGRFHLISEPGKPSLLYDLKADPHEQHNIAAAKPGVVSDLTRRLKTHEEAMKKVRPMRTSRATMSDELREQLRSLGYLQ